MTKTKTRGAYRRFTADDDRVPAGRAGCHTLANALRAARIDENLSQQALAAKVKYVPSNERWRRDAKPKSPTRSMIAQMENAMVAMPKPAWETLVKVLPALGEIKVRAFGWSGDSVRVAE